MCLDHHVALRQLVPWLQDRACALPLQALSVECFRLQGEILTRGWHHCSWGGTLLTLL